jgi:hypothetical protein
MGQHVGSVSTNAAATGGADRVRIVAGGLLTIGLALASYGAYLHFSIAARVRAGNCDGCAPWHPLFVVAPLVLGSALALGGGSLIYQR